MRTLRMIHRHSSRLSLINSARGETAARAGGRPMLIAAGSVFDTVDATGVERYDPLHHTYFAADAVARDLADFLCKVSKCRHMSLRLCQNNAIIRCNVQACQPLRWMWPLV